MSRDYKPVRRGYAKRGKRSMGAGVMIGMLIGLVLALIVAAVVNFVPTPFVDRTQSAVEPEHPLTPPRPAPVRKSAETVPPKPDFDFYTMLPELRQQEPPAVVPVSVPVLLPRQYFLQAGAFRSETEADNLKAKLALLGFEARIQAVKVADKGVLHRVRLGPVGNPADAERLRNLLAQSDIQAELVTASP